MCSWFFLARLCGCAVSEKGHRGDASRAFFKYVYASSSLLSSPYFWCVSTNEPRQKKLKRFQCALFFSGAPPRMTYVRKMALRSNNFRNLYGMCIHRHICCNCHFSGAPLPMSGVRKIENAFGALLLFILARLCGWAASEKRHCEKKDWVLWMSVCRTDI